MADKLDCDLKEASSNSSPDVTSTFVQIPLRKVWTPLWAYLKVW